MLEKLKNQLNKFNDLLADKLSLILSAMVTFYIVLALVLIPLFYSQPTNFVGWASYLCSVIFQGIALPILGYTSRKASDVSDKMLRDMYSMTKKIEELTEMIKSEQDEIQKDVDDIQDDVDEIETETKNKTKL
jgi:gas vesicle protein